MKSSIVKHLFCYLVETLKYDEEELKAFGYEMGRIMLVKADFPGDEDLQFLLYKITYTLLPQFYSTSRTLEVKEDTFLIVENSPLFSTDISIPSIENKSIPSADSVDSFCCDSIVAGAIEMFLKASGFESEVTAHNCPVSEYPYRVIYQIRMLSKNY